MSSNFMRLDSEGFDQAASLLARAMNTFNTDSFSESVLMFRQSVYKYQTLLGMQAENELRASQGLAQAYDERAFNDV